MRVEFKCAEQADPVPPAAPRARGTGARLVVELVALAGGHGVLLEHRQRAWASVTFSGTRHELVLRFEGEEAVAGGEVLIAALSEHEFTIPRQLVADAAVVAVSHAMIPAPLMEVRCDVLMLDED